MTAATGPAARFLIAGCLLFASGPAYSQGRRSTVPWEGSEFFRNLLHSFPYRCEPLQEIAELAQVDPDQTVVIVLGDNRVLDAIREQTGGLAKFHERGGALLIASDRADEHRLEELHVQIVGQIVQQAAAEAYRQEPRCPFITDFRAEKHPLFEGIRDGIATNLPSYLKLGRACTLEPLAELSGQISIPGQPWPVVLPLPYLIGTGAAAANKGRIMVLAGHGVFQNQMMVNQDNFLFTLNTVRWLTEGGRRKKVLFVEEGKVQTSFEVPLAKLPLPPLPRAEILNKLLHGLEEENQFNGLLMNNESRLRQGILLGCTLLLLLYGFRRVLRARHRLEPQLPLVWRHAALALAAPPVHVLRRQALLQAGNLWELARDLVRGCLEAHDVPGRGQARPPPFAVNGGWWQRWRLGRLVSRLWDLAYGPPLSTVSPRGIRRVQEEIAVLTMALEAGIVVFDIGA
jgi:hypothetical protein